MASAQRGYAITGLHHVQLAMPPTQEEVAESFYCGVLGFEKVKKPEHLAGRGGCWFRAGDLQFHLGVEKPFRAARKAHPAFKVQNLDALMNHLEQRAVPIVWDTQLDRHKRFYISDPFGNRLELIECLESDR